MKSLTRHTISGSLDEGTFCYTIEPTCCTPQIVLHQSLGKLSIRGVSMIADPQLVYGSILKILSELDINQWNYFVMEISLTKYDFETQGVINKMINILAGYSHLGVRTLIKWPSEALMVKMVNINRKIELPFNYLDYKEILALAG